MPKAAALKASRGPVNGICPKGYSTTGECKVYKRLQEKLGKSLLSRIHGFE
jgi:hypothetical protein